MGCQGEVSDLTSGEPATNRWSLAPVGEHPLDTLHFGLIDFLHPVELAQNTRCLATAEVTLHPLRHHDLSGRGDLEPALRAFMRFQLLLRHGVVRPPFRADSASI